MPSSDKVLPCLFNLVEPELKFIMRDNEYLPFDKGVVSVERVE